MSEDPKPEDDATARTPESPRVISAPPPAKASDATLESVWRAAGAIDARAQAMERAAAAMTERMERALSAVGQTTRIAEDARATAEKSLSIAGELQMAGTRPQPMLSLAALAAAQAQNGGGASISVAPDPATSKSIQAIEDTVSKQPTKIEDRLTKFLAALITAVLVELLHHLAAAVH